MVSMLKSNSKLRQRLEKEKLYQDGFTLRTVCPARLRAAAPAALCAVRKLLLALLVGHVHRRWNFVTDSDHTAVASTESSVFSERRWMLAGGTSGGDVGGIGQAVATLGVGVGATAVLSGRALRAATAMRHLARGYFVLAVEGASIIKFFLASPPVRVLSPWTPLMLRRTCVACASTCSCSFLFFRVAVVLIIEVAWVRGHRVAKLVWMQSRQRPKRV